MATVKAKKPAPKKVTGSKKSKVTFGALKGQVRVAKDAFSPMELVVSNNGTNFLFK
jgi:hypothetical protein